MKKILIACEESQTYNGIAEAIVNQWGVLL